jgi:uncharacterized coiled-coil DUF342 family protein
MTGIRADDEMTPVTMIQLVREELKDDISAVDGKVETMAEKVETLGNDLNGAIRSMERLAGAVDKTNELIPKMLDTLTGELRARRSIDEKIKTTESEITRHRELSEAETDAIVRRTEAETGAFVKRTSISTLAKVAAVLVGPTVLGAIIGYYFLR